MITYSTKMDEVFNVIFIKNPAAGLHWGSYLDSLTNYSWIVIGICIVATTPILFITIRYLLLIRNVVQPSWINSDMYQSIQPKQNVGRLAGVD